MIEKLSSKEDVAPVDDREGHRHQATEIFATYEAEIGALEELSQNEVAPLKEETRQKIREVVISARERMQHVVQAGALALALIGPGGEVMAEEAPQAPETVEAVAYEDAIAKLQRSVLTDETERLLLFKKQGDERTFFQGYSSESSNRTFITGADVDRKQWDAFEREVDEGVAQGERVTVKQVHTHPMKALVGPLTFVEEGFVPAAPASQIDLMNMMHLSVVYEKEGVAYETAIVDPSGVWEFTPDPNNEVVQKVAGLHVELGNILERLSQEASPATASVLKGYLNDVHPGQVYEVMRSNPATVDLADTMYDAVAEYIAKNFTRDELAAFTMEDPSSTAMKVLKGSMADRQENIQAYIDQMKDLGISVRYTPK